MTQAVGCTELHVQRQTVSWNIKGAASLFDTKLLPVWKLESPSFETSGSDGIKKWHLVLAQSKTEFLKCALVEELPVHASNNQSNPSLASPSGQNLEGTLSNTNTSSTSATLSNTRLLPTPCGCNETQGHEKPPSGAIINDVFIITKNGDLENFVDVREKYEESSGWTEWAGKFVEKRKKLGITEYIFGKDDEAYENAIPLSYLIAHQDRYLDSTGALRLQAELAFTSTVKIPADIANNNTDGIVKSLTKIADERNVESENKLNSLLLAQRLAGYFKESHLSDFTLDCEGRTFPVHKIILEARAPSLLEYFLSCPRILPNRNCNRKPSQIQIKNSEDSASAGTSGSGDTSKNISTNRNRNNPSQEHIHNSNSINDENNGVSSLPVCPCISPAFRSQSIIVSIDNIRSNILEFILKFIYLGTLSDSLEFDELQQVSHVARKYNLHDLTYFCFLKCLHEYRDCLSNQKAEMEELIKDIFFNAHKDVFENRSVSLPELQKLHPLAFQHLDGLIL